MPASEAGAGAVCAHTLTLPAGRQALDLIVLLDESASSETSYVMMVSWQVVTDAIGSFAADPQSAGIGLGLQVFPVIHPGTPSSCASSADCTVDGMNLGPCRLRRCDGTFRDCDTAADCGGTSCDRRGICPSYGGGDHTGPHDCTLKGDVTSAPCGPFGYNDCTALTTSVCGSAICVAADYAAPTMPIGALPETAGAFASKLASLPRPDPGPGGQSTYAPGDLINPPLTAFKPTAPALDGTLSYAKTHAGETPERVTAVVLVSDGLVDTCSKTDGDVAGLAGAAAGGASRIRTFVFDATTAAQSPLSRLDGIALAGGTTTSYRPDDGNVGPALLRALGTIRDSAACDWAIPTSASAHDLEAPTLRYAASDGATTSPPKRGSVAECDADGGWYYGTDATTGKPAYVALCPATCKAINESTAPRVELGLGCMGDP